MTTNHTADATQGLSRFHSLDLLSTLIAVLRTDGSVQFANAALENTLGLSRRTLGTIKVETKLPKKAKLESWREQVRGWLGDGR
mgnify:CR=1 FL=1